ncbi:hypothetical protein GO986_00080 [Deinococcus sp. HMF7620]|uniref:Uncharacterized protein n=1 Tax=Deinococcus arboris TaxID=2682977 RepID=A0A7C9HP98_9DEIO|nr:hypothetical protein [Deinococcus arboris]MVN85169.1 hypothetical protein [Deinococcus arboris]
MTRARKIARLTALEAARREREVLEEAEAGAAWAAQLTDEDLAAHLAQLAEDTDPVYAARVEAMTQDELLAEIGRLAGWSE